MLRKRTRSLHREQQMSHPPTLDSGSRFQSDHCGHSNKSQSLFGKPGLFTGLSPVGLSDSDSVRSPTSPLDFRVFSNLGNPFKSLKSPRDGYQKSWDFCKVGLGIVDSLDDDDGGACGKKNLQSSESKNILFAPRVMVKTPNYQTHIDSFEAPKSLPKNFAISSQMQIKSAPKDSNFDVVFEIGETPLEPDPGKIRPCSLDSWRSLSSICSYADRKPSLSSSGNLGLEKVTSQASSPRRWMGGSPNSDSSLHAHMSSVLESIDSNDGFPGSLSASEIELSEDYTCVISHGPNPKTTHIFGDRILECHNNHRSNSGKDERVRFPEALACSGNPAPYPPNHFLSFCYSCNKKLEEGKDIYIYRGEKAFCSLNCRSQEILMDEEMEKAVNVNGPESSSSPQSNSVGEPS